MEDPGGPCNAMLPRTCRESVLGTTCARAPRRRFEASEEVAGGVGQAVTLLLAGWVKVKAVVTTTVRFCNPMDCSLPGSSLHGILQARIWE